MGFEEGPGVTLPQQAVEVIVCCGSLEGELSHDDRINDDSEREYVDLSAIVHFALMNFRSHVRMSAGGTSQTSDVTLAGQSEVEKLDIELVVD